MAKGAVSGARYRAAGKVKDEKRKGGSKYDNRKRKIQYSGMFYG